MLTNNTKFQNIKFNSTQINKFHCFTSQLSLGKNFAHVRHVLAQNILYHLLVFHINVFNYCFTVSKLFYVTAIVYDYLRCELYALIGTQSENN